MNINSQFQGKSAETQLKSSVRQPQSGMQTLGKALSARRMPPPTNLPSLKKETTHLIGATGTAESQHTSASSTSGALTNAPSAPTWSLNSDEQRPKHATWSQPASKAPSGHGTPLAADFPKLDEVSELIKSESKSNKEKEPKQKSTEEPAPVVVMSTDVAQPQVPLQSQNQEPILKPSSAGSWAQRNVPTSTSDTNLAGPVPSAAPNSVKETRESMGQMQNTYQPRQNRPYHSYNRNYRGERTDRTDRSDRNDRNDARGYGRSEPYKGAPLVKEKQITHIDEISSDAGLLDSNWAFINEKINYDAKIKFDDDEDEADEAVERVDRVHVDDRGKEAKDEDDEESVWDERRRVNNAEMLKSIERAKQRKADEERRLSEKMRQLDLGASSTSGVESLPPSAAESRLPESGEAKPSVNRVQALRKSATSSSVDSQATTSAPIAQQGAKSGEEKARGPYEPRAPHQASYQAHSQGQYQRRSNYSQYSSQSVEAGGSGGGNKASGAGWNNKRSTYYRNSNYYSSNNDYDYEYDDYDNGYGNG